VSYDERGVPADPADEVRVAVVLEALAEHVQAGNGGDAAALPELAVGVEDGDAQPRVGPAVAGRPDHGADARLSQVQFVDHRCGPDCRDRLGVEDLAAQPVGVDVGVDPVEQGGHLPVRGGDGPGGASRAQHGHQRARDRNNAEPGRTVLFARICGEHLPGPPL